MKSRLLASSMTEAGLLKLIAEYFVNAPERFALAPNNAVTRDGKVLQSVFWRKKQKRYRFELRDF